MSIDIPEYDRTFAHPILSGNHLISFASISLCEHPVPPDYCQRELGNYAEIVIPLPAGFLSGLIDFLVYSVSVGLFVSGHFLAAGPPDSR
jgi:hypothetical protein